MLELISRVPESWRELVALVLAPIAWMAPLQRAVLDFFVHSGSVWAAAAKYVLLAPPALLVVTALWCTQLSLYTLPFRSRRIEFLTTLLLTWWDALRATWMYWAGLIRATTVLIGWSLAAASLLMALMLAAARQLVRLPVAAMGRLAGECFRPGMPWLAVIMLALWCVLEATIFTYLLQPTLDTVVAEFVGVERLPWPATPLLWLVLFLLVMSSFACIQLLVEAIKRRALTRIALLVVVECFVMVLGVAFLYRELAEAITPWLVQEAGGYLTPGPWFALSIARSGWLATRCLGWFLFGQYGTAPLLAMIARRPPTITAPRSEAAAPEPAWWQALPADVTRHGWLHQRSDELLEYLGAPVLHLVAAMLNFPVVLVTAQSLFSLPFQRFEEWRHIHWRPADSEGPGVAEFRVPR
jgi:hypothetical protein